MMPAEFAEYLSAELGWEVTAEMVVYWEDVDGPLGEVMAACEAVTDYVPGAASLLDAVPHSFPASALAGQWVTAYRFTHAGSVRAHADVATVTAISDRHVRIANYPPEPRTEGRAVPFRNEITAELASRHLVGTWKNMSDARYFGSLHLAVLPGETVMEGLYTGLASDVTVSTGLWRWVRLDPTSLPEELSRVVLREPAAVYDTVAAHSENNGPLRLADIGEEAE